MQSKTLKSEEAQPFPKMPSNVIIALFWYYVKVLYNHIHTHVDVFLCLQKIAVSYNLLIIQNPQMIALTPFTFALSLEMFLFSLKYYIYVTPQ